SHPLRCWRGCGASHGRCSTMSRSREAASTACVESSALRRDTACAMSQENVEIVRRAWESYQRGDLEAAFAHAHPDYEWDLTRFPEWPDAQLFRGRDAVRRFLEEWRASWEGYEAGVEEYIDLGDDRVLTLCWQRGRGKESEAVGEMAWAQIFTVRDGQLRRAENYADRNEALEAAGLSE